MVSSKKVQPERAFPLEEASSTEDDFASHVTTYNRFLSVAKWFVFHLAVLIIALYFGVIRGDAVAAFTIAVLTIAIVIGGFMSHRRIRQDYTAAPSAASDIERDQATRFTV